jgi:hypothetical protein
MARLLLQFYLYRLMKNVNRVFGTGSEVKNDQLRAPPRFMGFRCNAALKNGPFESVAALNTIKLQQIML